MLWCLGCGVLPITNQHPAWQCDASYAGPLGAAIATLLTGDPTGVVAATAIAVNGCKGEAALAAGPPAQVVTSTTTTQATSVARPRP